MSTKNKSAACSLLLGCKLPQRMKEIFELDLASSQRQSEYSWINFTEPSMDSSVEEALAETHGLDPKRDRDEIKPLSGNQNPTHVIDSDLQTKSKGSASLSANPRHPRGSVDTVKPFSSQDPITSQPSHSEDIVRTTPSQTEDNEMKNESHGSFLCSQRYAWMERVLVRASMSADFNESKSNEMSSYNQRCYFCTSGANPMLRTSMVTTSQVGHSSSGYSIPPCPPYGYPNPPLTKVLGQGCINSNISNSDGAAGQNSPCFERSKQETAHYVVSLPPQYPCHTGAPETNFQAFPSTGGCPTLMSHYSPAYCRPCVPRSYNMPPDTCGPSFPDYDRARRLYLQEQAKNAGICPLCCMIFCCCFIDLSKDYLPRNEIYEFDK